MLGGARGILHPSRGLSVSAEASRGDRCSHGHSQISLLPLLEDGNQVLRPGPGRP